METDTLHILAIKLIFGETYTTKEYVPSFQDIVNFIKWNWKEEATREFTRRVDRRIDNLNEFMNNAPIASILCARDAAMPRYVYLSCIEVIAKQNNIAL